MGNFVQWLSVGFLASGRHDAKSLLIGVLASETPLSAKELHSRIANGHGPTYQAVYKAARELESAEVLSKSAGRYSLNPAWVDGLGSFYDKATRNHLPSFSSIKPGTTVQVYFKSYLEAAEWYISESLKYGYACAGVDDCAVSWEYMWPISAVSGRHFEEMKELMATGLHYGLSKGDTAFDRMVAGYWHKMGKQFLTGENAGEGEFIASRDFLFQFYAPKEYKEAIGRVYSSRLPEGERLAKAHSLFNSTKYRLLCVVIRDQAVADAAKARVKAIFKRHNQILKPNKGLDL